MGKREYVDSLFRRKICLSHKQGGSQILLWIRTDIHPEWLLESFSNSLGARLERCKENKITARPLEATSSKITRRSCLKMGSSAQGKMFYSQESRDNIWIATCSVVLFSIRGWNTWLQTRSMLVQRVKWAYWLDNQRKVVQRKAGLDWEKCNVIACWGSVLQTCCYSVCWFRVTSHTYSCARSAGYSNTWTIARCANARK